jgi:hypothetical protein
MFGGPMASLLLLTVVNSTGVARAQTVAGINQGFMLCDSRVKVGHVFGAFVDLIQCETSGCPWFYRTNEQIVDEFKSLVSNDTTLRRAYIALYACNDDRSCDARKLDLYNSVKDFCQAPRPLKNILRPASSR